MISPELLAYELVIEIERQWKVTFFRLDFIGQIGFKLFVLSQENQVKLDCCFELVFEGWRRVP
jgi:hypothetical protein